ncbi:hypothetical protein FDE19_20840 [Vibrio parahaemolyticus]|uniref:DUF5677 domain-containing protein n=1 Tax=Vibrio parahaemolyticus TaxID=670 RepID=UPI0011241732|nr:DUF5677 domain-containing protein [Vibrio parahaemolyticus]EGR0228444.1 hypothetical protein [Vibrio parahaemolyticus]EHD7140064.1 hypothetical protein [Vibrio parahaemolyticus]EIF5143283.1 hypothetical protein [Vibrio parahaemolyticus]EJG2161370.1 hypothetical protein [Vibrio parahaemolyticus]EJR4369994.1 hypothetical protein [Vibrio parahaemolyticus]
MVKSDDYALFYKVACNIFESGYEFINETDENYYFLNVAAIKLLKHINTTEMLMTSELDLNHIEGGFTYYDTSSVVALLRVCYENLVTIAYHYFVEELNYDRLNWYQLCGYKNRAKNTDLVTSPDLAEKMRYEQRLIEDLTTKLKKNEFEKPKKNDWKPLPWYQLGQELGIPTYVCNKYSFWSSHTHTGFDSLMQVNTAHNVHPMEEVERNKVNYLFLCSVLVFFIEGYVEVLRKLGYPLLEDLDLTDVSGFAKFMKLLDDTI